MRREVHRKALRAASNVAFSVALIGCGAASEDAKSTNGDTPDDGTAATAAESELRAKPKHGASCHDGGAADAKPADCKTVVDAAFPTAGDYPGTKQDVSSEVQACCLEMLTTSGATIGVHRWDCCANVPSGSNVMAACTPWGPPVPPAMKRRARGSRAGSVSASIEVA